MLEVHDLKVRYGAAPALWGVSLEVHSGELVCVDTEGFRDGKNAYGAIFLNLSFFF